MKRRTSIIISIAFGVIFFFAMLPLQFDRGGYIPLLHSVLSILLNVVSVILLSTTLYRFLRKTLLKNRKITAYYLLLLAVAHGVYSVMFWSSKICLGLIALWLIIIVGLSVKK